MTRLKGILCGILTSATFGMIPLFTLPLMKQGMTFLSILFYRFLMSSILLAGLIFLSKQTFRVTRKELFTLMWLSVLYTGSALFLFWGYNYMPSGAATTIVFLYPIFVAVVMACFFGEKASLFTYTAIVLAVTGVALLSGAGSTQGVQLTGVIIEVISALSYALYIVGVNQSCVKNMGAWKLTFYVFVFDTITFAICAQCTGGLQSIPGAGAGLSLFALALVPTVISNLSLVYAIKWIGSTFSSILGAFEPLTAMCIGIWVFGEPFTVGLAWGLVLVINAVSLIIFAPAMRKGYRRGKLVYITKIKKKHPGMIPYH